MKNWIYFIIAAFLAFSFYSCKDDDDYSAELAEIKKLEKESTAKLDSLTNLQEELKQQQEALNKQQEELNQLQKTILEKTKEKEDTTTSNNNNEEPKENYKKYENPNWKSVKTSGDYAYSMTVVFELPSDLKTNASKNDVIAAFVGSECRAVAKANGGVFFLNVIGTGEESEPVTFRYWNAGNGYLYESTISLPFTSDYIYGVVDNPKSFDYKQL